MPEVDVHSITTSTAPAPAGGTGQAGITWRNLNWSVGKKQILYDVSGDIPDGACCAILGPSGSGKTTLLNALAGRLSKVDGTVEHGGVPFTTTTRVPAFIFVKPGESCGKEWIGPWNFALPLHRSSRVGGASQCLASGLPLLCGPGSICAKFPERQQKTASSFII